MENPYYRTCPYCGSNNDPGETCDCLKEKENKDNTNSENNNDKDTNN